MVMVCARALCPAGVVVHVATCRIKWRRREAKEPPHGGGTTTGQSAEDPVAADAGIVTDRQLGTVGKVDAGLLAAERM